MSPIALCHVLGYPTLQHVENSLPNTQQHVGMSRNLFRVTVILSSKSPVVMFDFFLWMKHPQQVRIVRRTVVCNVHRYPLKRNDCHSGPHVFSLLLECSQPTLRLPNCCLAGCLTSRYYSLPMTWWWFWASFVHLLTATNFLVLTSVFSRVTLLITINSSADGTIRGSLPEIKCR